MTGSDFSPPKTYQQDDIQEILQIAIARQTDVRKIQEGEFTQEQLQEMAADLGISAASLQAAEQEWLTQQLEETKRQSFNLYRRDRFRQRTITLVMLGSFLLTFDLMGGGGIGWSRYFILIFGFIIAFNTWKVLQTQGENYEREFARWETKRQIKQTFKNIWDNIQKALQS